MHVFFLMRSFQ